MEKVAEELPRMTKIHVLQMVADYSIMLKLRSTLVIDLLTDWASLLKLEQRHLRELIIDIKTFQPIQAGAEDKTYAKLHLGKRKAEENKYETPMILIIAKTVKYITKHKELLNILLLSKQVSKLLKERVYKQVLLHVNFECADPQRLELWKSILGHVNIQLHSRSTTWTCTLECWTKRRRSTTKKSKCRLKWISTAL